MSVEKHSVKFRVAMALMIAFVFVYLVVGELILPSEVTYNSSKCGVLDCTWYKENSEGQKLLVNLPYEEKENDKVSFVGTLPEIDLNNTWIMFWNTGHVLKVFVGDDLRYSYDTTDSRIFGESSPHCYIFTELSNRDSGKEIRIQVLTDSKGLYDKVYIGDQYSLIQMITRQGQAEVTFAFFLLLMGILCAITSYIVEILFKQSVDMKYLSLGVIITSIWILSNGNNRQFIFPNISVMRDIAYFCVAVMPLPFIVFIDNIQKQRHAKIFNKLERLVIADFIVTVLLYTLNLAGFNFLRYLVISVGFISIILILFTLILDIINRKINDYKITAIAFAIICCACGMQLIVYMFGSNGMYRGLTLEIGLFVGLMIAISNLVYQLMELNAEKNRALRASKEKNNFLAGMSHEIRTPINSVLGMNEMILRESKELNIKEYSANIENSGNMLLSLINDILDFSKIESGKMDIICVEYQLSSVLNDLINMNYPRAEKKKLEVRVDIDPNVPEYLYGDEVRIRQVITNILTNAIKYTDEGFVELSLKFKRTNDNNIDLIIRVRDSGRGIKKEAQDHLFEAFQRLDEAENRGIEGTGLGLAITYHFVKLMGGNINVKSELGKGSTFTVRIPQKIVKDVAMGDFKQQFEKNLKEREVYKESFQAPDAKVLIVDDNKMNLMVAAGLLKQTKIQVTCANGGRECIEDLKKNSYDLILLDHMMPDIDGVETLNRIRQQMLAPKVPIIALTANAVSGAKEMYLDYGFSDYLSKPILGKSLERLLLRWLPKNKIIKIKEESVKEEKIEENQSIKEKFKFLDVDTGLKYCMDDEDFYCSMLSEYASSSKIDDLDKYLSNQDWDNYRISVHALKSTSLNIGAVELSQKAKLLEEAIKNQEYDYVNNNHESAMEMYGELLDNLLASL